MPRLSVITIRLALAYFGIGMTLGGIILWNKGMSIGGFAWQLLPAHIELLLFGWLMQFVMGVAFWIVPRFSTPPKYGRTYLAWWSFSMLNLGLWLVLIQQLWLVLLGRILMFMAVIIFAVYLFPRIKSFGK